MKVLLINSVCGIGSTGRICTDLAQQLEAEGHEVENTFLQKYPKKKQESSAWSTLAILAKCRM